MIRALHLIAPLIGLCIAGQNACCAQNSGFTIDSISWSYLEDYDLQGLFISEQNSHHGQSNIYGVKTGGELTKLSINPENLEIATNNIAVLPDISIHSILETNTGTCVLGNDETGNGNVFFIEADGALESLEVDFEINNLVTGGFFVADTAVTLYIQNSISPDSIMWRKWSVHSTNSLNFEDVVLPRSCADSDIAVLRGTNGSDYLLEVGCGHSKIFEMATGNLVFSDSYSWGSLLDVSMKFVDTDQDDLAEQYFLCKRSNSDVTSLFQFEPAFPNGITTPQVETSTHSYWQYHGTQSLSSMVSFSDESGQTIHGLVHTPDSSFRLLSQFNLRYGIPLGKSVDESISSSVIPGYNDPQFLVFADDTRVGIAKTNSTRVVKEFSENDRGGIGNEDHFHARGDHVDLLCVNQTLFKSWNTTDTVQLELIHQFNSWAELDKPLIHFNHISKEFRILGRNNLHYVLDSLGNFKDTLSYESPSFLVLYDIDDLDGDGDGDVWFYRDGFIRILKNISGSFGDEIPLFELEQSNWNTQASDVDGNGLIDFVWHFQDSLHIATNQGDFTFTFSSIPLETGSLVPTYADAVHGSFILIERDAHIIQYQLQEDELVHITSIPIWSRLDYASWRSYSHLLENGELEIVLGNLNSRRAFYDDQYFEPFNSYAQIIRGEILTNSNYNRITHFKEANPVLCEDTLNWLTGNSNHPFGISESCNYNHLVGCMDVDACNYDSSAVINSNCEYSCRVGCMDSEACNFDETAIISTDDCDYACFGCTIPDAINFSEAASFDDGSCIILNENCPENSSFSLCPTSNTDTTLSVCFSDLVGPQNVLLTIEGTLESVADFLYLSFNDGQNETTTQYTGVIQWDSTFSANNGLCIEFRLVTDASLQCSSGAFPPLSIDVVCSPLDYVGCMDVNACNYVSNALVDKNCFYPDECGNCFPLPELNGSGEKRFIDRVLIKIDNPDTTFYEGPYYPTNNQIVASLIPIAAGHLVWPGYDNQALFWNYATNLEETELLFYHIGQQDFNEQFDHHSDLIAELLPSWSNDANTPFWLTNLSYNLNHYSLLARHASGKTIWRFDFDHSISNVYKWQAYPVYEDLGASWEIAESDSSLQLGFTFAYDYFAPSSAPSGDVISTISYAKADYAPYSNNQWDIWHEDSFAIFRNNNGAPYNPYLCDPDCDSFGQYGQTLEGSLWGPPNGSFPTQFSNDWQTIICNHPNLGCNQSNQVVGEEFWVYVESLDETWSVVFNDWTCCNDGGGFAYTRTLLGEGPPSSTDHLLYGGSESEVITATKNSGSCNPQENEWLALDPANNIYLTRSCGQGWYNPLTQGGYQQGEIDGVLWGPANSTNLSEFEDSWSDMMCGVFNDCSYACYLDVHSIYVETTETFYNLTYHDWSCGCCEGNYSVSASSYSNSTLGCIGNSTLTFTKSSSSCDPNSSEWVVFHNVENLALTRSCNQGWYNPYNQSWYNGGYISGIKWGPANSTDESQYHDSWQSMMCYEFNDCSYACNLDQHGLFVEETGAFYNLVYHDWSCGSNGGNYSVELVPLNAAAWSTSNGNLGCSVANYLGETYEADGISIDTLYFGYTGELESVEIPVGVSFVTIQAKGADGGSSVCENQYWESYTTRVGGRGALVEGTFYEPPATLNVMVGQPGISNGCYDAGSGGGASGVFAGLTPLIIAGGGGGAEVGYDDFMCYRKDASLEEYSFSGTLGTPGTSSVPWNSQNLANRGWGQFGGGGYQSGSEYASSLIESITNPGLEQGLGGGANYQYLYNPGGGGGYSGGNSGSCASGGSCYNDGWFQRFEIQAGEPFVQLYLITIDTLRCGNGCLDPLACNYDASSLEDDGSCEFESCAGCADVEACNFDEEAIIADSDACDYITCAGCLTEWACNYDASHLIHDESLCDYTSCAGCLDPTACNYDEFATIDSFDCIYPEPFRDCAGSCFEDYDMDGVCDEEEIAGCTYPGADNFNSQATDENGSCIFNGIDEVFGCTYSTACNFNPEANFDDASCVYPELGYDCEGNCIFDTDGDGVCNEYEGCTNLLACNYDPQAIDNDGTCVFALSGYDCDGNCLIDTDGDGICDEFEFAGCTDPQACNYYENATDDDGSCYYAPNGFDCNGNCFIDLDADGICDVDEIPGCQLEGACNYNPLATDNDGSCIFPDPFEDCLGACLNDQDGDGICDELEIPGCTYAWADNFNPLATDDDGSCEFMTDPVPGCIYPTACNYQPEATADDGSCIFPTLGYTCSGACIVDTDNDGVCDMYEIPGCMDPSACNYVVLATDATECNYLSPGYDCSGNCILDQDEDGLCDPVDGCTNPLANNYDETATNENGTCTFDCTDCAPVFLEPIVNTTVSCITELPDVPPAQFAISPCDSLAAQVISILVESNDDPCLGYRTFQHLALNLTCGNFTIAYETVSIAENSAPEIVSLPQGLVFGCDDEVDFGEPLIEDACSPFSIVYSDEYVVGICASNYEIVRTVVATDVCGNTANDSYSVIVIDSIPPEIVTVAENISIGCGDVVPEILPNISDACSEWTLTFGDVETELDCPSNRLITRTFMATDECGNTAQSIQEITILDEVAPILETVPGNLVLECGEETPTDETVATDACSEINLWFVDSIAPGECPQEEIIYRYHFAEDACGNQASATQIIEIVDNTPPAISGEPLIMIDCSEVDSPLVTSSDACGESILTYTSTGIGEGTFAQNEVRIYTSTDECGNSSSAIQLVEYTDGINCGGCTYIEAQNYDPEAMFDDGTCVFCSCAQGTLWSDELGGCVVDENALIAVCGEGTYWDSVLQTCMSTSCAGDLDGDGVRGTSDLLLLLSLFEIACE